MPMMLVDERFKSTPAIDAPAQAQHAFFRFDFV
jgi:hypothetical protein